ncbi:lymphocyte antigen 75-like [Huso huso]|uniref:Lymphocyte antigen 75-like n=1 Tax=Huso huso TaxID=61971 RepID=A0ABR0YBH0_HUSHU
MEKLVLLMLLLAGICAVASGHFRKYHFVKDEKSWFDAQSYCREKHTDLATIESQEETEKVLNISAGFNDAWIGLYYDKENWQWSNGDNVSYYNWTSSLNCTSVDSKGEWVDSDCNNVKYYFICYNGKVTFYFCFLFMLS